MKRARGRSEKLGAFPHNSAAAGLPTRLRSVLDSYCPGWTLERSFYTDTRIFELEMQRIFRRHWLFAGHVSRVTHPGDFFTYEIDGESVILLRDAAGDLRAFLNVCRHRGARICSETAGHVERFSCPYHQWTYGLDGSLLASRFTPEGFDPCRFGLHQIFVTTIEGLIFICFSDCPPGLERVSHDIRAHIALHELATAQICRTRRYSVRANWKLINENARECYHCPGSHPEYCGVVLSAAVATSASGMLRARTVQQDQEARWRNIGLATDGYPFRPDSLHSVNRYALRPGALTESDDGAPVAPLMGSLSDRDVGVVGIGMYPNLLAEVCSDHAVTLRFIPITAQLTDVEMTWLVRGSAAKSDFDADRVERVWRATAEQDWHLCELNQLGVNSARYEPGPYTSLESGCAHFDAWCVRELTTPA
jgi:Rieske 2Fe-2S family protein